MINTKVVTMILIPLWTCEHTKQAITWTNEGNEVWNEVWNECDARNEDEEKAVPGVNKSDVRNEGESNEMSDMNTSQWI